MTVKVEITEEELDSKLDIQNEANESDIEVIDINYSDYQYISDLPDDLKTKIKNLNNCIIDKGITGCGLTNYYLTNEENVVLIVPRTALILSKKEQIENILDVHGKSSSSLEEETNRIEEYMSDCLENGKPIKIIASYDSIPTKVSNGIEFGMSFLKLFSSIQGDEIEIKLIVDEFHFFLLDWSFRTYILNKILQRLNWDYRHSQLEKNKHLDWDDEEIYIWKNIVFISATPIENKYLPKELKKYPIKKLNWKNPTQTKLKVETGYVDKKIKEVITDRIKQTYIDNVYIFCNSVDWIHNIIKSFDLKLNQDNTKIVCSKSRGENVEITIKRGEEKEVIKFKIKNLDDKDSKGNYYPINFITSTAFAGVDCYDKNVQAYIISKLMFETTLYDISLDIRQIIGRFRNCKDIVATHYFQLDYKEKPKLNKSLLQYKRDIFHKLSISEEFINTMNPIFDSDNKIEHRDIYKFAQNKFREHYYVKPIENELNLELDEYMAKYDVFKYDSKLRVYKYFSSYKREAERYGITVISSLDVEEEKRAKKKKAYKVDINNPEIKEKIKSDFQDRFGGKPVIPMGTIKEWLREEYEKYSIRKAAKGIDIKKYYNVDGIEKVAIYEKKPTQCFIVGKYAKLIVCFSGIHDTELETIIVSNGGKIVSGVSKRITHLIVDDITSNTKEMAKAKELKKTIITIIEAKNLWT
jgi:NAD-dependent DNA ligase (contains BRCT domain type II)